MEIIALITDILLIVLLIATIVLVFVLVRFAWNATLLVKALWADLTVLIETLRNTNELTEEVRAKLQILNEAVPLDAFLTIAGAVMNLFTNNRSGNDEV